MTGRPLSKKEEDSMNEKESSRSGFISLWANRSIIKWTSGREGVF